MRCTRSIDTTGDDASTRQSGLQRSDGFLPRGGSVAGGVNELHDGAVVAVQQRPGLRISLSSSARFIAA